jgi:hypothetical protein
MKKEELYLNENACEILLNIPMITKFMHLLFDFEDIKSICSETLLDNNSKLGSKCKITYRSNSVIIINCSDGRELRIEILNTQLPLFNVRIKTGEHTGIVYTLKKRNEEKDITENNIEIVNINYKNTSFKKCLANIHINEENNEKWFNHGDIKIDANTLEPVYYSTKLPSFNEIKNFDTQKEIAILFELAKNDNLSETTKELITGLSKEINNRKFAYDYVIREYNEWLKGLDNHKEIVDILHNNIFTNEELNEIFNYLSDALNNECAMRLIKSLKPDMVEAIKRQLKN